MPDRFLLHSEYQPTGDQPAAIEKLSEGILAGVKDQVLLGVTGSGKTFTMANVIAKVNHDRYGYDGYSVCGLCQTGVPCESCIPGKTE